jgi:hypothetical protein
VEIIRAHNTPNKVTLYDGTVINRDKSGKIWIPEWGTYVVCTPYDNHFVFEVPQRMEGPSHMCSCGGESVIVGAKAYSHLSSNKEAMMVCQHHTMYGRHADGSS